MDTRQVLIGNQDVLLLKLLFQLFGYDISKRDYESRPLNLVGRSFRLCQCLCKYYRHF